MLTPPVTQAEAPPSPNLQTITYESSNCTFDSILPLFLDPLLECGYLTVPERHADPTGPTIRLAVVIYKSRGDNPQPDPIILAQGGPGGSTIDAFNLIASNTPLRDERDIILFDQRGTLYSEPNLLCTESFAAAPELLALPDEEAMVKAQDLLAACRDRLEAEGVNLAAYNSLENAADVEALRLALGYDEINFYGISYGTLLGLHLMRKFPDHLRSVILDGVVPPQLNFITLAPQSTERVYKEFFSQCAADPACRQTYPDLETRLFRLADRLNEQPITILLTDSETGQQADARLTGDGLLAFVFQLFYIADGHAVLPKVLEQIEGGDYSFLQQIWPLFVFDRTFSEGMYLSVICAEDADFNPNSLPLSGVRSRFAESAADDAQDLLEACQTWNVPALPASIDETVVSDVPTLLLSGQLDPITPPAFAAIAAKTLPNSYNYVLSTGSHGVALGQNACVTDIVLDFIEAPTLEPRAECLDEEPPLDFVTESVLMVPLLGQLNQLDRGAMSRLGLATFFLMGALSPLVVWPMVGLVRLLFGKKKDEPADEAGWMLRWGSRSLIVLFDMLAIGFVGGLIGVFITIISSNLSLALLSAVPGWAGPLFILPPLLFLLALVIVITALFLWVRRNGSTYGRLYYTAVAGCTLGYVIVLTVGGMMTVLV